MKMRFYARELVDDRIKFLSFWGSNGTGKTTALMAITNELISKGVPALYVTAADLMEYIKAGIGQLYGPDERVAKVSEVGVLCLDELSQVKMTEYVAEKIETIIDRRYRYERRTVVALDQNPDEVLSPRMVSRLRSGVYFGVDGPDLRPLIAEQQTKLFKDEAYERGE